MITPTENAVTQSTPVKTPEDASEFQLKTAILSSPFQKLGMALSGGGFRAAAYSLGAMSYLHYLQYPDNDRAGHRVLDNVEFIASASGGTFAGILYTMHVCQKKTFQETFTTLLAFLNGEGLLENVLKSLNSEEKPAGDKSQNLINAFARIYDEKLFDQETFGVYWPKLNEPEKPDRQIEVCFNSTEFYRGISFRFQASNGTGIKGSAGNKYIYFDKWKPASEVTLKKLKLGDILAASSCFPAGFEPILFPTDFTYTKDKNGNSLDKEQLKDALIITDYNNKSIDYGKDIGLMDGGINDNQAVYSAMLADIRRRKANADSGFDLVFVTDVASYFMKPYEAPVTITTGDYRSQNIQDLLNRTLKTLLPAKYTRTGLWTLIILLIFTGSAFLSWKSPNPTGHDIGLVLASCSGLFLLSLWLLNRLLLKKTLKSFLPAIFSASDEELAPEIKQAIPALKNFSDQAIGQLTAYLKKAPLGTLEQILKSRLNSMLSMVLEINLKQTRRLIFGTFYGEFYGKEIWQNRRVFNVIYELSTMNSKSRADVLDKKFYRDYAFGEDRNTNTWAKDSISILSSRCEDLQLIAERARTMGTTLWTDDEDLKNHRIRDVIACGQFTTCAKLLEYCFTLERILDQQTRNPNLPKQIQLGGQQQLVFQNIKAQLLKDWARFKTEPLFVYEEYANPKKS